MGVFVMPGKYRHALELLPQIKNAQSENETEKISNLAGDCQTHNLIKRKRKKKKSRDFHNSHAENR